MNDDPTRPGFKTPPGVDPTLPAPPPPPPSFLRPPAGPEELGRFANYRVLRQLGQGGMGTVWQAEDLLLRRPVALKIMNPELPDFAASGERFLREARSLAGLSHDHLVSVYQAGQDGDVFYLAMQLLEGETLHAKIARDGPPPPAEILRIARETARGLSAIHAAGLVHRDLKPSNLWLEAPSGRVKILDFGLARPVDAASELTRTGAVLGTPAFMAPEQARGRKVDARSDLFSFGAVLYCLCTGRTPFRGDTLMAQLTALAVDTPPPVRELNRSVPAGLSALVARLLSKEPAARPPSAEAVLAELDRRPSSRKAALPLAFALVLAVVVGAALWRTSEGAPPPSAKEAVAPARTYLIDLVSDVDEMESVWLPAASGKKGRPQSPGPPGAFFRFSLGGPEDSPHGIGMHPGPRGPAFVRVKLDGRYRRFRARVGQNEGPPRSEAGMRFSLVADGKEIWTSPVLHGPDDDVDVEQSVEGVRELRLEVHPGGAHPRAAHALWFEPVVE